MATVNIPNSSGQIRQPNKGDVFGELWATFNIDLTSSPGKIKTSRQLYPSVSEAKMDNDNLYASVLYEGYIYNILSGSRFQYMQAYRNPRLSGTWTSTSGALSATESSDAVVFGGELLVSLSTNIAMNNNAGTPSWDTDWWTAVASGSALTSGVPHIMNVSNIGAETLFVTDGKLVRYYNPTAGHSTVTLADHLVACSIATDYKATFVGTYSNSGDARVYEIYIGEQSGGTPIARNSYKIDGTAVLTMSVGDDGNVYIITDRGHIQVFNGVGFVTVASFPFAFDAVAIDGMSVGDIEPSSIDRGIHPKGMKPCGKSFYININTNNQLIDDLASNPTDNDDIFSNVVVNERSASGVWEFDIETRVLNHRYALKYDSDQVGFHRLQTSAPILVLNNQYTRILTSGRLSSGRTDIFVENPDQVPTSYFITSEIDSKNVEDAWANLVLKSEELQAGESIEIKYRTSKNPDYPLYVSGTFAGANTFNTLEDLAAVEVGDEIELVDGAYAGQMAHVVSKENAGLVTVVTLDRDIAEAGTTCYARFQNWKLATIEDEEQYQKLGLSESTTWVQFKVVLVGNIEVRTFTNRGNSKSEV